MSLAPGLYQGYDAIPPYPPVVDHPHERAHQHQSLMRYLMRQQPDPEKIPNYPDVDLRDFHHQYAIEIEVPGIKDPSQINCRWTSTRSLVVTGEIHRPSLTGEPLSEEQEAKDEPCLLAGERKVGKFRRVFNFPVDVDINKMTAKLSAGVLLLRVPKKGHQEIEGGPQKVAIQPAEFDIVPQ